MVISENSKLKTKFLDGMKGLHQNKNINMCVCVCANER